MGFRETQFRLSSFYSKDYGGLGSQMEYFFFVKTTSFVLQRDQQSGEFLLVSQFLTPRFLNMEAMARTFKQLWRSTNGFKIRNHKDQRVLFVFDNLGDVGRILQNQLWSFDKHLVMLQRYNSDIPMRELVFKTTLLWVQVHDIPVR